MTEWHDLGSGIYWIGGGKKTKTNFHCNPYLIKSEKEIVLIDPGSISDYPHVRENISNISGFKKVGRIITHHQDPDVCSCLPRLLKDTGKASVVTHWRTSLLIPHYGVSPEFYLVNENNFTLKLQNGRELLFIPAPYLHFPGAFMTYDPESKTLFSGDLFGAISDEWNLFAGEKYSEEMSIYHEHYMPGTEILSPVMNLLMNYEIERICPQHGSIIIGNTKEYITQLRDLECGTNLDYVRSAITKFGDIERALYEIIKRLKSVFGTVRLKEALKDSQFEALLSGPSKNKMEIEGWNRFFNILFTQGGMRWITMLEPLIKKLCRNYHLPEPDVIKTASFSEQKKFENLLREKQSLISVNRKLLRTIENTNTELTKDPVSGLYNERFFYKYLANIGEQKERESMALLFIGIDNMSAINTQIGDSGGDEVINNLAQHLKNITDDTDVLFRLRGPNFACLTRTMDARKKAEYIRMSAGQSGSFSIRFTLSVGIINFNANTRGDYEWIDQIYGKGIYTLNISRNSGGNQVLDGYTPGEGEIKIGRLLIIDYDTFHAEFLKRALEPLDVVIKVVLDGEQAVDTARTFHPDIIISELFIPKMDAFRVKEILNQSTKEQGIEFILVSHKKDEESVVRAIDLGITHYLQKPYILPELLGITNSLLVQKHRYAS